MAALSVSGPSGEFTPAKQKHFAELITEVAGQLAADPDFAAALSALHLILRPAVSDTPKLVVA